MKKITIALVGQPNVGKSMLINSISNARLKVGNFPGVTVEKVEKIFTYKEYEIKIIDLPGTYALNNYTQEEKIAKEFIENGEYDLILNVVDSTNLERNLYLTSELLQSNHKMVIALNMYDEAEKESIKIDNEQLSKILGVSCLNVSAQTKQGLIPLMDECIKVYNEEKKPSKFVFSEPIEVVIEKIATMLDEKKYGNSLYSNRALSIKLLSGDKKIYNELKSEPLWIDLEPIVQEANQNLYKTYNTNSTQEIFAKERAAFSKGARMESLSIFTTEDTDKTLTDKIDAILLNKFLGIPIFLFLMWAVFQLVFVVGSIPMDWIDAGVVWLQERAVETIGEGELSSLIADGIIAGVGAVIMFLPNIIILFLGITLLEMTGYMSRAAFLLDGFLHRFGLHGKSFISLISGFGCSVPAYMSTRILKNDNDRLLTLFIIAFMSCGAKLPVYVLFVGAFFSDYQPGNILFIIYIAGALFGLIVAKILRVFVFKGKDNPFVLEMPKYRFPSFSLLLEAVWLKAWMYLKKAGTFILAVSILIWFASTYPKNHTIEDEFATKIELVTENKEAVIELENELSMLNLENSYLGKIG
ncbi:MAG: ferrous iron transport protein B, partial [Campylobacteraceae bacterium]|nr:ferrous iron transport protein B [Campylobacteraceae bacterium]